MLEEVAKCVPALTPSVAKCYGTGPADVFFQRDSGEARTIVYSGGVQQGDPMGPAMFCPALRQGLKRFRLEFEGGGVGSLRVHGRYISLSALRGSRPTRFEHSPSSGES